MVRMRTDSDVLALDYTVYIDGFPRDPTTVSVLDQRNLVPGGHRFDLIFRGPGVERLLPDFAVGRVSPLDESQAREILEFLDVLFEKPLVGIRYLLNSVDYVEVEPERVRLAGVCSAWLPETAREP
jgi:hypothetical protein